MASRIRHTEGGAYSSPKTVLGFYAGILAIVEAGVVGAIAVLANQKELRHLIIWVLIFGAVVLVALIVVVVAMNLAAPMKLQLQPVTAQEFIQHERLLLGDSSGVEFTEDVVRGAATRTGPSGAALPAGKDSREAEE